MQRNSNNTNSQLRIRGQSVPGRPRQRDSARNTAGRNVTVARPRNSGGVLTAPTVDSVGGRQNPAKSAFGSAVGSQYLTSLRDPFSIQANGVRVPDLLAAPTSTLRISKRFTVNTDASGNISGLLLPHPYQNAFFTEGTVPAGGTNWVSWTGNVITNGSVQTTTSNVSNRLSNYRVVSWGAKVLDLASMTNVSGQLTVAKIPLTTNILGPQQSSVGNTSLTNGTMTRQTFFNQIGVPYTGSTDAVKIDAAALVSLPSHKVYTGLEVAQNGVRVISKPVSMAAFELRPTADSLYGDDLVPGAGTTAIYVGDSGYLRLPTFELMVLAGTGFPASTGVLDIELVYHLEGTPYIQNTGGVSVDGVSSSPVKPLEWLRALDAVATIASFVPAMGPAVSGYRAMRQITA